MFRKYLVKICGISLLMAGLISGCSIEQTNETKVSDLTYTIVEESETPEELKTMIEEKKTAELSAKDFSRKSEERTQEHTARNTNDRANKRILLSTKEKKRYAPPFPTK